VMREQARSKLRSFAQSIVWKGRAGWRRGLFALIWVGVRFWLAQWLWGTGLRLVHFPPPAKRAGTVLALVSLLLFIWATWGFVKAVLSLGLKRCAAILLALLVIVVGFDVLTLPSDQSRISALFRQIGSRVVEAGTLLGSMVTAAIHAPGEFSFAYNGTRSPPKLPPGFPTPDPQATPIQVVAHRAGQLLSATEPPHNPAIPEKDVPSQTESRIQVGGFAQVVKTDGKTLQAREQPGAHATIVARFPQGTRLAIIGGPQQSGDYTWWQVRNEQGQEGWCADAWLEAIK
jgi:hypothetical protein